MLQPIGINFLTTLETESFSCGRSFTPHLQGDFQPPQYMLS